MTTPSLQLLSEAELVRVLLGDEYEILEELGRGGMAIVFRARERALDREVAIKVLPARLVIDKGFVERFEHEARTAARLEHPNIVPIYRVGRAGPNGDVIYFVMKLLRGQSLSAVLGERGKLDPVDVRRILMETAAALGYAAKRGVVHRDIKPDNIMLDSEGRCVITDFGIAKSAGGQVTTAGISLGTPRYMSPEHARGLPLDGRSDMYSLGVVAYQCLIGKTPFDAEDPFAVLYKHIHEPLPEPTLTSDDERQLFGVIARMLAKKPDDRFQTSNELIAALGGQISDPTLMAVTTSPALLAPTEMIPTPQPWSVARWKMRSRAEQRTWIAVSVIAAVGVVAVPMTRLRDPTPPTAPAMTRPAAQRGAAVTATANGSTAADTVPPKPEPSPRAAAIIAANKVRDSRCPKGDTLSKGIAIDYAVLVDSIHDRARADSMRVDYDVCGLAGGTAFTTTFTLTKLRQRSARIFHQDPHHETDINSAGSLRSREKWTLNTREMSAGPYRLEVVVTDAKERVMRSSRQFQIRDK